MADAYLCLMKSELQTIIYNLQASLSGEPWYGKSVYTLIDQVHPALVYRKPQETGHSLIELLYHMLTWSVFTLQRIKGEKESDMPAFEALDWRTIDPQAHTWSSVTNDFRETNEQILQLLQTKEDSWLDEKVDYRNYKFRSLLHGITQHHIYHAGQIAYVSKLFQS